MSRIPLDTRAVSSVFVTAATQSTSIHHNVTLPLRAMRELHDEGVIGELAATRIRS